MSSILWIILIVAIFILTAKLSKLFFKTDTYLGFLIMIKTRRFIPFLDKLAKHKKLLNILTDIGIVFGFGAFGLDYLYREKLAKKKNILKSYKIIKRVLVFIISTIIFSIIGYFGTLSLLNNNPLITGGFVYFIVILTGIMGLSGFTIASLVFSAYDIVIKLFQGTAGTACPGVGLVIPGVKMPKIDLFIPWYGWIILIVSAIIHEFSHGALLRTVKAKVKSMGFILATILPLGAFVEPDEKDLSKKKNRSIMRMYSAGPMSNVILAIIFLIIMLLITPTISNYSNQLSEDKNDFLYVSSIQEKTEICGSVYDSPSYGVLKPNDKILSINQIPIRSSQDMLNATKLNSNNVFVVKNMDTNKVRIEYLIPNEMGKFGFTLAVQSDPNFKIPFKYYFYKHSLAIVLWTAILNFLIATVNYLPTFPFDGGGMSKIIFSDYLNKKNSEKKRMSKVSRFFGTLIVILLLLNIIPYFF
jgi:membrane-associated protease RseP (regulator of RpoE activity)